MMLLKSQLTTLTIVKKVVTLTLLKFKLHAWLQMRGKLINKLKDIPYKPKTSNNKCFLQTFQQAIYIFAISLCHVNTLLGEF